MNRDLLLVAISLFTWGLGEGMFIYFQPLYLQQLGANVPTISAILGGMGIAMAVAHIPAGYLADRLGPRPVMWASWLMGLISAGLMALASSLPVFVIGLLMYGVTAFVSAPLNSYVSGAHGRWSLGRALTTVSAFYTLGAVIGPLLGGAVASRLGLQRVYLIAALIFLVSTAIIIFIRPQPPYPRRATGERFNLVKNVQFTGLLGLALLVMFATYLPQPLAPLFLQNQRQLSLQAIGQLGSLGSLGNTILQLTFGRLNATSGLLLGQLFLGVYSLALFQGTGLAWYSLGYFFIGGYRLCRLMLVALTRPLVHTAEVGLAYGLLETVNGSAVIIAPLVAGFVYQRNPSGPFMTALGLLGVSLAASLLFIRQVKKAARPATAE